MTADTPTTSLITCSQCGGELHPDEGQIFLTCPYCSAAVYLDTSRVVFHWYLAPTLDDQQALGALRRWMSGSQTVKDLDKKASVVGQSFQYFPVWYIKREGAVATPVATAAGAAGGAEGGEQVSLQPAAAISVTELKDLKLPAGDLRKYDPSLDAQSAEPTVPLESALEWSWVKGHSGQLPTASSGDSSGTYKEAALVHVPLYFFKYAFRGGVYTAIVDAASGTVLASLYPPKQEAPYRLVGIVTALVFLCLATVPLGFGAGDNFGAGLAVCGGLGLVAAPLLFGWAFWVASRV